MVARFPSSCSQSGMRAGEDVCLDDGATARGRAPRMMVKFISSRPQSGMRAGDDNYGDGQAKEIFRPGRPPGGSPMYKNPAGRVIRSPRDVLVKLFSDYVETRVRMDQRTAG